MANSDKDILITPNTGQTAKPKIEVTGANNATKTIEVNDDGSLTFNSTIQATTGSVANGNANLVTGDAVFDYIAAQNFASAGASNFVVGDITGQSELTSGLQSTDELVLSDGGSLARMDISVLQSYMQSNLNFTTDTVLTSEQVQDIVGAMVDGGTETNIAVTYDDTNAKLNFVSTDTNTQLTQEQVEDYVGGLIAAGTGISVNYDDAGGSLTITNSSPDQTVALTAGSNVSVSGTYPNFTIASTDTNTQLSTEQVQDIIGAMVSGNTETNIAVTYDDTNGKLNFVSTDTNTQLTLLDEDDMSSNSATAAASQQSIKAYVDSEVSGLVDSAPSALNTLNELAAALGDDASFSTTTATSLGNRLRVDVNTQGLTSTQQGNALTNLGITASLAEINILDDGLAASDIPNLAASKITSGTLGTARIPSLATSKITSGTFADARIAESNVTQHLAAGTGLSLSGKTFSANLSASDIPNLAASKITSGTFATARIADDAITTAKIADDQITNALMADDAIDSAQLADASIDEVHLNATNTAVDNYLLSFDSASGGFTWVAAGAGGENNQNAFSNVAVSGQTTVAADSATDTLTLAGGSNVTITTNATSDTVTIAATDTNTQLSTEQVQDIVGGMLVGTETRIAVTYDDTNGRINFVVDDMTTDTNTFRTVTAGGNTLGSTETLAFTAGSNVTISESGGAVTIASTDTNTQLSNEQVQDIVGAMFTTTNTETGITVTYQDTTGDIDLVVGTLNQDTTGNAATATALETARNIGGVSFDGTANINLPGVNTAGNQNTSGNASTATLASTVTVSDSTANTNFPVVFHNESNGLLDDTGALRYNPSTGTLLVPNLNVAGTTTTVNTVTMEAANAIVFEGATSDANETTLTITDPTADRTITLPNASGTVAVSASSGIALSSAGDITANLSASHIPNLAASKITSGTLGTDRIPSLATSKITSGTFANGRISEASVTQHQAALSITESQISDLGSYITAVRTVTAGGNTLASNETLAFTAGSNVTISESGGAVTIASTDTNTQLSTEQVQDIAGPLVATGGTKTRIAVTYDDTNNNMDFVVDDMNFSVSDITGATALTSGLASTDEFVISDAGTLKRMDTSVLQTYMQNNLTFTTNTGTVTNVSVGTGLDVSNGTTMPYITLDLSEFTDMTATMVGTDEFIVLDAGSERRKAASEIGLSIFNNDSSFTNNTGTVTSVGITAGNLIDVSGSPVTTSGNITVNVDLSELTTSTTDGHGDYFAVIDTSNVQRKLTKGNIAISGFNNDSNFTSNTGTVTSVSGGTGLTGTVTTSGSISLANTAVTAGSYTSADITVDAQGRITAASSGSGGGASAIGDLSDAITTNTSNIGLGSGALDSLVAGSGNYNVALGIDAGTALTYGDNSTLVGFDAGKSITTGRNNLCLGYTAGDNISSGSNNVVIGAADVPSATLSDQLSISSGDGSPVWITGNSSGIVDFPNGFSSAGNVLNLPSAVRINQGEMLHPMYLVTNFQGGTSSGWGSQNSIYYQPFWSYEGGTMDDLQFRISTGNSSTIHLGIYEQAKVGSPTQHTYGAGDLLASTSFAGTSNNTSYTWSSINAVLDPQTIYWMAVLVTGGSAPTAFTLNDNAISPMMGRKLSFANYNAQEFICFQQQNQTSLPSTAPSVGSLSTPTISACLRMGWNYT